MFGAISAKFRTFDMQIHFAIPPNSAFLGLLEEFFFSISNIRKFHHIINQFVKKFSTFPDSPYLRQAYSLSPLREQYGNIKGNIHQFTGNEEISNFTTLGNNSDKTSYGFCYTKTTTIVESYKTFLGIKTPDKTRTETATYYMTVSRDKNNNVSFQTFSNEEAYKKATSNW